MTTKRFRWCVVQDQRAARNPEFYVRIAELMSDLDDAAEGDHHALPANQVVVDVDGPLVGNLQIMGLGVATVIDLLPTNAATKATFLSSWATMVRPSVPTPARFRAVSACRNPETSSDGKPSFPATPVTSSVKKGALALPKSSVD